MLTISNSVFPCLYFAILLLPIYGSLISMYANVVQELRKFVNISKSEILTIMCFLQVTVAPDHMAGSRKPGTRAN